MGMEATTIVAGEPARSFTYDPKRSLFEQFGKPESMPASLPQAPSIYQHLLLSAAVPASAAATSKKRTMDDVEAEDAASALG